MTTGGGSVGESVGPKEVDAIDGLSDDDSSSSVVSISVVVVVVDCVVVGGETVVGLEVAVAPYSRPNKAKAKLPHR